MHKSHVIGCAVGIALALGVVALSGGSAGSIGVLIAVLICPVVMVTAMWFMMRAAQSAGQDNQAGDNDATQVSGQ